MSDEELTLAMAELQDVVRCRCDEAYRDRGLKDPYCECDSADAVKVVASRIKALDAKLAENEVRLRKAVEALDEAVYLLKPDEKDMMRQAGVYRIVTTLAEIKGESHE